MWMFHTWISQVPLSALFIGFASYYCSKESVLDRQLFGSSGMMLTGKTRITRKGRVPVPLCPPEILHKLL
jgi:hypothetical protein